MDVPVRSAAKALYRPDFAGAEHSAGRNNKNDELRDIVASDQTLPDAVRAADPGYIDTRVLGQDLLDEITSQSAPYKLEDKWPERLARRRQALEPYVGRLLTCVLIRVPGTHYTIEIDPIEGRIVYWEWQPYSPARR